MVNALSYTIEQGFCTFYTIFKMCVQLNPAYLTYSCFFLENKMKIKNLPMSIIKSFELRKTLYCD